MHSWATSKTWPHQSPLSNPKRGNLWAGMIVSTFCKCLMWFNNNVVWKLIYQKWIKTKYFWAVECQSAWSMIYSKWRAIVLVYQRPSSCFIRGVHSQMHAPAPTCSPPTPHPHHVAPFIKSWNNVAGIYYLIQEPGFICTTETTILNLALISFDLCGTSSVRSACSLSLVPLYSPLFTVTVIWTMMKHRIKSTQLAFLWMSF